MFMEWYHDFDLQIQRPVSRATRLTSSATDASQLRGHGYGTHCQ